MNNENCTSCIHWDFYISPYEFIDELTEEQKERKPNNCIPHLCGSDNCQFNRIKSKQEPYGTWLDGQPHINEEQVRNCAVPST
jgi:hypothetical protein